MWYALSLMMRDCVIHLLPLRGCSGQTTPCTNKLSSSLKENYIQVSPGPLLSTIMERGKTFMSWPKPIVLPSVRSVCFLLSGWYTAHASALAPVPSMTLPFLPHQVDHYFLSYAWHLTQIWDACEASCKLPMAKANRPLLPLQWSSPTMCCPYL